MGRAFDHAEYCFPRGYLAGLTLSTSGGSTAFTVAVGEAVDSTQAAIMQLTTSWAKSTSAFVAGNGNGGLDTGAIANSTFYHVFLIYNVTTRAVDVLVSLSATAPTMPSGFTLFRRIGSIGTDASSKWLAFTQNGDEFLLIPPINSVNGVATIIGATNYTLAVPSGIKVNALVRCLLGYSTAATTTLIKQPDETSGTNGSPVGNYHMSVSNTQTFGGCDLSVRTNTSGQITAYSGATGATLYIVTYGWIDTRGRFS